MTLTREQREAWREEDVIEYALDPHLARTRILALLDALDAAEAKVAEGQEHIAYHLRDFRPRADMAATGDLAVDMVAYADRLKARAELAESERDEAVAKVARAKSVLDCRLSNHHDYCASWRRGFDCDCWRAELTAALDTPATDEGGE